MAAEHVGEGGAAGFRVTTKEDRVRLERLDPGDDLRSTRPGVRLTQFRPTAYSDAERRQHTLIGIGQADARKTPVADDVPSPHVEPCPGEPGPGRPLEGVCRAHP